MGIGIYLDSMKLFFGQRELMQLGTRKCSSISPTGILEADIAPLG